MSPPTDHQRDPIGWTLFLTLVFALICAVRLTLVTRPYFDEVHYLPAARAVLALSHPMNIEHPPLGKQLIALGMLLFGDRPLGWRVLPALFGTLALFSAMRAMWFASCQRFATLAFGVLLITGFALFVQSRIAMLDIFMIGFTMLGLWMFAAATREAETARWRLAICGLSLGAAIACKWNAAPVAALPGLIFLVLRVRDAGWRFLTCRRGAPIPGMTLFEAFFWLGLLPLATYAAAFWPFLFFAEKSIQPWGIFDLHRRMLSMQEQLLKPHIYESVWYQWVVNWRAIWYFYEDYAGAQRGVVMLGNPLTMLLGLPAVLWCAWAGILRRRSDALLVFALYAATLGMWIVAAKNVQFYYHYLLPGCFLLAALALALGEFWQNGRRWLPLGALAASTAMFIHFWPIISFAALKGGPQAFTYWMWLPSWR